MVWSWLRRLTLLGLWSAIVLCGGVLDTLASGLSIANGDHPAVVQEKLASFLRPEARKAVEAAAKKG